MLILGFLQLIIELKDKGTFNSKQAWLWKTPKKFEKTNIPLGEICLQLEWSGIITGMIKIHEWSDQLVSHSATQETWDKISVWRTYKEIYVQGGKRKREPLWYYYKEFCWVQLSAKHRLKTLTLIHNYRQLLHITLPNLTTGNLNFVSKQVQKHQDWRR